MLVRFKQTTYITIDLKKITMLAIHKHKIKYKTRVNK